MNAKKLAKSVAAVVMIVSGTLRNTQNVKFSRILVLNAIIN